MLDTDVSIGWDRPGPGGPEAPAPCRTETPKSTDQTRETVSSGPVEHVHGSRPRPTSRDLPLVRHRSPCTLPLRPGLSVRSWETGVFNTEKGRTIEYNTVSGVGKETYPSTLQTCRSRSSSGPYTLSRRLASPRVLYSIETTQTRVYMYIHTYVCV